MDIVRGGFEVGNSNLEVRRANRVLLGLYAQKINAKFYSRDHYALVRDKEHLLLQPVADTEWQSGSVVQLSGNSASGGLADGHALSFQGSVFSPSGSYWVFPREDASRLSRDGNYLALASWSGTIQTDLTSKTILEGSYFIDIYEVPAARRVARAFGEFSGFDVRRPLSRAVWVGSPTYITPLTDDLQRLLICDVSNSL
jgi:hypothetical protein